MLPRLSRSVSVWMSRLLASWGIALRLRLRVRSRPVCVACGDTEGIRMAPAAVAWFRGRRGWFRGREGWDDRRLGVLGAGRGRRERCEGRMREAAVSRWARLWVTGDGCLGGLWMRLRAWFLTSRGCLGCCSKPAPIIAVDEPAKGLKIQGRTVRKPTISDELWSTSTCEMENSAVVSQRSISSISTSTQNQNQEQHGVGSSSNSIEFVNHGLLLWNQNRQQWVGHKKPDNRVQKLKEPRLSWNATYDSLLLTNKPFAQPVPLPEMVDFLVDVWEQEGLYD